MQAALEVAAYVLGLTVFLGVVLVAVLLRDILFHGRFTPARPSVTRVPTTTLDAVREVIGRLEALRPQVRGERRQAVDYELRHLQMRLAKLEDKAYTDQSDYYNVMRDWEKDWLEWRTVHEELGHARRRQRARLRAQYEYLRQQYRRLEREAEEEWHRAVARDRLTLEELRAQGVLDPEPLRVAAAEAAAEAAAAAAAQGAPPPDAGPAGEAPAQEAEAAAAARRRPSAWATPLPPFPLADKGVMSQADVLEPGQPKRERVYLEPTLDLSGVPDGVLAGADLTHSSFVEVVFTGVHRYEDCAFVATDLRRIELRRAERVHQFLRCDLRGAFFTQSLLANTLFRQCDLSGTHWRGARLDRVAFEQCVLHDVHWEEVDLSRTVMSPDTLESTDFSEAGSAPHNVLQEAGSPPPAPAQPASAPGEEGPAAAEPPSAEAPESGQAAPEAPAGAAAEGEASAGEEPAGEPPEREP